MTDLLLTLAHIAVDVMVLIIVLAVLAFIGGMFRIGTGDGEGGEGGMGYELIPRSKKAGAFHIGAFNFTVLLDAYGYLFPCIHEFCRTMALGLMPKKRVS